MPIQFTEGKAPFTIGPETFSTWYKFAGDLKSSATGALLIVLHGGPGVTHYYTLALADLAAKYNTTVIFYDQLGCGNSTHLKEKPKEFWTPELFMDELENLIKHLGVEKVDVLGHSWGGMLGATWAATRQPATLRKLIISDSPASMSLWIESTRLLIAGFPKEIQDAIEKHEREGTTDSKEYQDAVNVFYERHVCRVKPWPDMLVKAMGCLEEDPTVYHTMNGPSEFTITGSLKTWTIIPQLPNITQPALVINGKYDEAQDVCVVPFFKGIEKVKWVTFAESSHMPMWEETERYLQVVNDFLSL